MNLFNIHKNFYNSLKVFINNFEYQIKVMQVLVDILKIKTDNPLINDLINTITYSTYKLIPELEKYINKIKLALITYLKDIDCSYEELKIIVEKERNLIASNINLEKFINERIIALIEHKYIIDDLKNEETLGL